MSWASVGTLGAGNSISAGTTVAITTSATAEAGNFVLVTVALDNTGTTDSDFSEVSSITDSAGGNTWTKCAEYTNGQGSAAAGVTISAWRSILTNQIASGGTITANLANSVTSKALSAWEFTLGAGSTVSIAGSVQTRADDAVSLPGSQTISGLTSGEYLFVRAIGSENLNTTYTPTTNYTALTASAADTGTAATSANTKGEFRILTGTGDTSDPVSAGAGTPDRVSVYFALLETPAASFTPFSLFMGAGV